MKSSKNILKGIGSVVLSSLIIIGCGDENLDNPETIKPGNSTAVAVAAEVKDVPIQKLDNAIFSIPSPIQLGQIIQKSGAAYNEDLLNDPSAVNNYSDVASQALNLGVYGADLGYTALYEKKSKIN